MKALGNGGCLLNAKVCLQPASHSCTPRCPQPAASWVHPVPLAEPGTRGAPPHPRETPSPAPGRKPCG